MKKLFEKLESEGDPLGYKGPYSLLANNEFMQARCQALSEKLEEMLVTAFIRDKEECVPILALHSFDFDNVAPPGMLAVPHEAFHTLCHDLMNQGITVYVDRIGSESNYLDTSLRFQSLARSEYQRQGIEPKWVGSRANYALYAVKPGCDRPPKVQENKKSPSQQFEDWDNDVVAFLVMAAGAIGSFFAILRILNW